MTKKITFLGIETSCDETAASVIRENDKGTADVLSNIVSSQISEHKKFGGVVPELAARAHIENIEYIIKAALEESKVSLNEIDGIAATAGPGLIVCLTVGFNIGKSIAAFTNKPFVAVNHLEGHALSPGIENNIQFPYLLLLISGGHSQFLIVKDVNEYEQLGTTIDDALGEAFDKTAKMLDLGYPGGPSVEKASKLGDKNFFKLPEPIINKAGCNLSFAGLKTAVLRESKKINGNDKLKFNLAASFQNTVNSILKKKTQEAMTQFKKKKKLNYVILGRGAIWSDAGKIEDFSNINNFVTSVEKVQRLKIGCLDEISYRKGWITKKQLHKNIKFYGNCPYSDYLKNLKN